jgi:hypothetical protein
VIIAEITDCTIDSHGGVCRDMDLVDHIRLLVAVARASLLNGARSVQSMGPILLPRYC